MTCIDFEWRRFYPERPSFTKCIDYMSNFDFVLLRGIF